MSITPKSITSLLIKAGPAIGAVLVGFSAFYYLVIFLPQKHTTDIEMRNYKDYQDWKDEKFEDDIKLVEAKLKERWKDEGVKTEDYFGYVNFGDSTPISLNGKIQILPAYTEEQKANAISNNFDELKDPALEKQYASLLNKYPNWRPMHIVAVLQKKISEGMSDRQVEYALGKADKITSEEEYEVWWYWTGDEAREKKRDLYIFAKSPIGEEVLIFKLSDR